jgi:NTP pyrophosphatase (non-canonical NTP hydrolase)
MKTIRGIQAAHREWYEKNFGEAQIHTSGYEHYWLLRAAQIFGGLCHHSLKAAQGIRPDPNRAEHVHYATLECISKLTEVSKSFSITEFTKPFRPLHKERQTHCILGAFEELGELTCAHQQGDIDGIADAIGDVHLYLTNLCNLLDLDHESIINKTAEQVHARDWRANPEDGRVAE